MNRISQEQYEYNLKRFNAHKEQLSGKDLFVISFVSSFMLTFYGLLWVKVWLS